MNEEKTIATHPSPMSISIKPSSGADPPYKGAGVTAQVFGAIVNSAVRVDNAVRSLARSEKGSLTPLSLSPAPPELGRLGEGVGGW